MQIDQDPKLTIWFSNIEASPATKSLYSIFIKMYCECVDKTPTHLIEEAIKEIKAGKMPAERKEAEYFAKFKEFMRSKGYADKSFAAGMASVRSFYKNYDIVLPNGATRTKKAKPKKENQNFLSKADIQKILINAKNLREKAVILIMSSSGMAINEIVNLQVKDIKIDSEGISTVSVRRNKTDVDFTTFFGPEATEALKNYWEERNRDPETQIIGRDDYVITNYGNRHKGGKMNKLIMCKHFRELGNEIGYGSEAVGSGRKGYVKSRSHSFRKFFITTLKNAGMPADKVEFMAGHARTDIDVAYNDIDINKLKELYKTYLPYLTFEKTINIRSLNTEDARRLEELSKENEALKIKLDSKDNETHDLAKRIEKQENENQKLKIMFNEDTIKAMIEARVNELLKAKK